MAALIQRWMVVIALFGLSCVSEEILRVREMHIHRIDLDTVRDGEYAGTFTYGSFTYEVRTLVRNRRMESVAVVRNRNTKYALMAEGVIPRIILKQSPDVDAVTGATTTSKALMKAVENSLRNAR